MTQPSSIYGCLGEDSLQFAKTRQSYIEYTPWNHPDPEKRSLSKTLCRRLSLIQSARKSRTIRRSEVLITQKKPIKSTNYMFNYIDKSTILNMSADKFRVSTPIIRPKKNSNFFSQQTYKQPKPKGTLYVLESSKPQTCSLFLFRPRNPPSVDLRNRNIQTIRHIPKRKLFKDGCYHSDFKLA